MSLPEKLRSMARDPSQQIGVYWELCEQAAYEIERLEKDLAEEKSRTWPWAGGAMKVMAKRIDELEKELEEASKNASHYRAQYRFAAMALRSFVELWELSDTCEFDPGPELLDAARLHIRNGLEQKP